MAQRMWHGVLVVVSVVGLTACSTTDSGGGDERIGRFLLHLNNDSKSERWRDGLIEIGRGGDRDLVLQELTEAYDRSLSYGGHGVGMLRPPGRYRVMEVVGGLGKTQQGVALLKRGLDEGHRIGLVAAVVLVSWGDTAAIPILAEQVEALPEDDPDRKKGLLALQRATKTPGSEVLAVSETVTESPR